ncbi:hypothetical protein [Roseimaritima ulvae]|uniref:Uncharacterized protein n=1 Tax=Roseimaritima ulvae TaxID=980254 RepID=A0A5B9QM60_9BACT|nr:hypothetical protein [Roseimaritima ulvae]QEG39139.1 hypothetical protein UC8_11000 [Roseimaritima ulvae]
MAGNWVEIEFDCLPLRTVTRLDVPVDASPKYEQFVLRVKEAINKHGTLNTYYLYQAHCTYHLTNDPQRGMVRFSFEGTVLTDQQDRHSKQGDLIVSLDQETCAWLTEPMVEYLSESVRQAVLVEFDRYIEAGDLEQTKQRIAKQQAESDEAGGFVGMYL